ncbi:MAG TPA: hypothetical protein PK095_21285, partial [Myxococcota bacterium]|nr:hypothetical protein [Myxococcota bacterium]
RPSDPAEPLGSIVATSFSSAPRFPGRLGEVLHHLERLDETLVGLVPRPDSPNPLPLPRSALWPRTPDRAALARLAPPPPKKGSLSLTRAVVFPEVGEELLGF